MTKLHRSEFLKEAKELFPELREELNRQYGLLHLEMHAFCDFVNSRIRGGDAETVKEAFQFAERIAKNGNSELQNAVGVSFLEHLDFADGKVSRSWARELMPTFISKQYEMLRRN